jgi:hypothetical protein
MDIRIRCVGGHRWNLAAATAVGLAVLALSPMGMADSKSPTPLLVELFTSEGCSSCPPADAFLRMLDSTQPVEGVQFIVLEEHVDYWDDQGWRDPFSSHDLTLRQASYTQRLKVSGPYTPEMVVDGAYEFTGSDREKAAAAFEKARLLPTVRVKISSAKVESGKLQAHIETDAVPGKADVFAALVLDSAESQVQRGENGGHRLQHVAVVRNLKKIGKTESGQGYSKDVTLDARSLPHAARLIVFLQEPGQGKILGAAVTPFAP